MTTTHHVYARCWGGRDQYLQTMFSGSRAACRRFIDKRVRNNQPTHFLIISCCDIDAASRRYLP